MKLTYNILCIDNDIKSLADDKAKILDFNSKNGIKVIFTDIEVQIGAREEPAAFKDRIKKSLNDEFETKVFELILTDLHMTGGVDGNDVIEIIRKSHTIYRPIIFYSGGEEGQAGTAEDQLNAAAKSHGVFGKSIFITNRDDLSDVLKRICKEMHDEEQKLNNVRGLLMDRTSEVDAQIIQLLGSKSVWDDVPQSNHAKITKYLKRKLMGRAKKACELSHEISTKNFSEIQIAMNDGTDNALIYQLGSLVRSEMLREVSRKHPKLDSFGATLSNFYNGPESLSRIRDKYAHRTGEDLLPEHTDQRCIHVRNECRNQIENIQAILD